MMLYTTLSGHPVQCTMGTQKNQKYQGRRKVPRSGAAIYRGRAAADNFSSVRSAKNFLTYQFFTYEETALVASRYFEGHALTLCIYAVTV